MLHTKNLLDKGASLDEHLTVITASSKDVFYEDEYVLKVTPLSKDSESALLHVKTNMRRFSVAFFMPGIDTGVKLFQYKKNVTDELQPFMQPGEYILAISVDL